MKNKTAKYNIGDIIMGTFGPVEIIGNLFSNKKIQYRSNQKSSPYKKKDSKHTINLLVQDKR